MYVLRLTCAWFSWCGIKFYFFSLELQEEDGIMDGFSEIDNLLDGDSQQKTKAYGLLLELKDKVRVL